MFQEAANLFLDQLGKLLAQPDDSKQTLWRDSLMVIYSFVQIFVFDVFPHVSPFSFLLTAWGWIKVIQAFTDFVPYEEIVPVLKGLVVV